MLRKIFLAALLCLAFQQSVSAQYASMEMAILSKYSNVRNYKLWNYLVVPCRLNGASGVVGDYYVVYSLIAYSTPQRSITVIDNKFCLLNRGGSWSVVTSMPYRLTDLGAVQTMTPPAPTNPISYWQNLYYFYSHDDVMSYATGFNAVVFGLPTTGNKTAWDEFLGESSGFLTLANWGLSYPRALPDFALDSDGGGVPDWDEVLRYPPTNPSYAPDDKPCTCDACCSCRCTCGHVWAKICPGDRYDCDCHNECSCGACCSCECVCGDWKDEVCGGGRDDCDCHKVCICGACCSDRCTCGGTWETECDGTKQGCECHTKCTCSACCECKCTCGDWMGKPCDGGTDPIFGCTCHAACSCGACCSCTCVCGDWSGTECGGLRTDCACHRQCDCAACCICKCTCGKWRGGSCDGTEFGCDCHGEEEEECSCGACCSCRCLCGNWKGVTCGGIAIYCGCHACTCDACCSCKCVCGQWAGKICDGKVGSCSCHKSKPDDPEDEVCTCGACCRCRCICGKWNAGWCPGTPEYCECHAPIEGEDWYPMEQLKESLNNLQEKLKTKLGIDLPEILNSIEPMSIETRSFAVPSFVPGVSPFYVTVDFEHLAAAYSFVIEWFRNSIKWGIYFICFIKVLQLLFKF